MNKISWQYIVPKHLISCVFGNLAYCKIVWLKNVLIYLFFKNYAIDMKDALEPNIYNYPNLASFFIREARKEARPFACNNKDIACPVDGKISQIGKINEDKIIQAKGINFDLMKLLGGNSSYVKEFCNGDFATIYLAPHNYHRVYMPMDGVLEKIIYIPGELFAVNNKSASTIPDLFARNERMVIFFDTVFGRMAVVLVGAMIVSGIKTPWAHETNQYQVLDYTNKKINLLRGDEIGYFTFGSTVILLFQKDAALWDELSSIVGNSVKIGQLLGVCENTLVSTILPA